MKGLVSVHKSLETVHETLVKQLRNLAASMVPLRSRSFRMREQFQCNPPGHKQAGAWSQGQGQSNKGASSLFGWQQPDHRAEGDQSLDHKDAPFTITLYPRKIGVNEAFCERVKALEEEVRNIKAHSASRDQRQDCKHIDRLIKEGHRAKQQRTHKSPAPSPRSGL